MQTFKRGDSVRNTQTGDVGVVIHPPVYMENSRQWNVSVQIPGRKFDTLWYLPHVVESDPYAVVVAGDTVKIAGRKGSEIVATVDYVSRNRTWMIVTYKGKDYPYKNTHPIFGIMPAGVTMGGR
jgi:hypothetical protein